MPDSRYWRTVLSSSEPPTRERQESSDDKPKHDKLKHDKLKHEHGERSQKSVGERPRYPPRRFKCPNCTTVFRQKSHLNAHFKVVHLKIKPFRCEHCELAFGKRYDLDSHRAAVHNNVRPHSCEFCTRKFAKRSNLIRHGNRLHKHLMKEE